MPPSVQPHQRSHNATMSRIVGACLLAVLLALLWQGSGTASVEQGDGACSAVIVVAWGEIPDQSGVLPEPLSGDDGESEPDVSASTVAAQPGQIKNASRQSPMATNAPTSPAFTAYCSQAPPLA